MFGRSLIGPGLAIVLLSAAPANAQLLPGGQQLTPTLPQATTLVGGGDADSLLGKAVNVRIVARGGDDTAAAVSGIFRIDSLGQVSVQDTTGPRVLSSTNQTFSDEILGGSGDDLLFGDVICRDTATDPHNCVFRDANAPEIADPPGTPFAAADAATKIGDADRLSGGSGDDELHGGWDVDWLEGGAGADVLLGGIELPALAGFPFPERLYGGDGADRLYSNARNRRVIDPPSDVPAEPGALDAVLDGGDGADELVGAYATRDRMLGGDGADEIDARYGRTVEGAPQPACILHTQSGSECWDRLSGGRGDDVLWGSPAADLLRGGADDDELHGGAGNDWLSGGAGDDVVDGGLGADRLSGGEGDDVLVGTESTGTRALDTFISCGAGNDRVYRHADDGQAPDDCERVITVTS